MSAWIAGRPRCRSRTTLIASRRTLSSALSSSSASGRGAAERGRPATAAAIACGIGTRPRRDARQRQPPRRAVPTCPGSNRRVHESIPAWPRRRPPAKARSLVQHVTRPDTGRGARPCRHRRPVRQDPFTDRRREQWRRRRLERSARKGIFPSISYGIWRHQSPSRPGTRSTASALRSADARKP
jgi:hypothetical protein